MKVFLLSVLGSAVVAAVYGLVFAQRESAIREYLRRSARGLLRRLYIQALLGAVRGDATASDSRNLVAIICIALFVASSAVWYLASDIENAHRRNAGNLDILYEPFKPTPPDTPDQRLAKIDALKAKHDALTPQVTALSFILRTLGIGLYIAFIAGWVAWVPYVKLRARFAHEISRFSLRIQGLATQDELAELTKQELRVRDPVSLRQYVQVMKTVASGKGIVQLTKTFELWDALSDPQRES